MEQKLVSLKEIFEGIPPPSKPAIIVKYRKLGKEKALGLAYKDDREIHIDSRLKGKELLQVLIHECMHIQNPKWAEIKIEGHSKEMADIIWNELTKKIGLTLS